MPSFSAPVLAVLLVSATFQLTGCVVGEIHEEMVQTNATLNQLDERLELIERANELLHSGNQHLTNVQERLETMQSIDASLRSIDTSLRHLDEHLVSLRKTINKIPFVKESADPDGVAGSNAANDESKAAAAPVTAPE